MRILASRHQQKLDNAEDEILLAPPKGKISSKYLSNQDLTHSEFLILILSFSIKWFHHFYKILCSVEIYPCHGIKDYI